MTTIAWDGKTLAADKQRTVGGTPMACTKIFKAVRRHDPNMVLYGCAGDSWECIAFRQWVEGGKKPSLKNLCVIAIDKKSRAWYCSESLVWHEITLPLWAIGSGADYALGAMAAGKTAKEAIEIASQYDTMTGLGIDTLKL